MSSVVNGPRRASTAPTSLLLINSPWVKMTAFISAIIDSFYNFLFLKNVFTFISCASPSTNIQLPQERIDALISTGVFHVNANNARDVDSIYTPLAM